jgi:hypothetical protein
MKRFVEGADRGQSSFSRMPGGSAKMVEDMLGKTRSAVVTAIHCMAAPMART